MVAAIDLNRQAVRVNRLYRFVLRGFGFWVCSEGFCSQRVWFFSAVGSQGRPRRSPAAAGRRRVHIDALVLDLFYEIQGKFLKIFGLTTNRHEGGGT